MIKYADDSLSEEEFKKGNVVVDLGIGVHFIY